MKVDWENLIIGLLIFLFGFAFYLTCETILGALGWLILWQAGFLSFSLMGLAIAISAVTNEEEAPEGFRLSYGMLLLLFILLAAVILTL